MDGESGASFSEWESVCDDSIPDDGVRVEVELPQGDLGRASNNGASSPPTEMVAAEKRSGCHSDNSGSVVSAQSMASSFVPVSQVDVLSLQPKVQPSEELSDAASYQYNSTAASCCGDESSLISNFEILSLASGEVVRRCKRCKFHNGHDSVVCTSCSFALVANPNVEMDAQIALNLAMKEEQEARTTLLEEERKRKRICRDPLYDHACILSCDVREAVTRDGGVSFNKLANEDMEGLAIEFIKLLMDFPEPKMILFAYKCTRHNCVDSVCREGFPADQPFGDLAVKVEVSHSLANALDSFELLETMRGRPLSSIPEDGADGTGAGKPKPRCVCWVVALLGSDDSQDHLNSSYPPAQVLPLVYFDSSVVAINGIVVDLTGLLQGLERTFGAFFESNFSVPTSAYYLLTEAKRVRQFEWRRLTLRLPPGMLGVDIQKSTIDGTYVVVAKLIPSSPLEVGDVIESFNETMIVDVEDPISAVIAASAGSGGTAIVVRRMGVVGSSDDGGDTIDNAYGDSAHSDKEEALDGSEAEQLKRGQMVAENARASPSQLIGSTGATLSRPTKLSRPDAKRAAWKPTPPFKESSISSGSGVTRLGSQPLSPVASMMPSALEPHLQIGPTDGSNFELKSSHFASDDGSIQPAEDSAAVGLNDSIGATAAMLEDGGADDDILLLDGGCPDNGVSRSNIKNNKRSILELTEEEQLQQAIRTSMEENAGGVDGIADCCSMGHLDVSVGSGFDDASIEDPTFEREESDQEGAPSGTKTDEPLPFLPESNAGEAEVAMHAAAGSVPDTTKEAEKPKEDETAENLESLKMEKLISALAPFGDGVIFSCEGGQVLFWTSERGIYGTLQSAVNKSISCLASAPPADNEQLMASGDTRGVVVVYRLVPGWEENNGGTPTTVLVNRELDHIMDLRFPTQGGLLAAADRSRGCNLWSLPNGSCICSLRGDRLGLLAACFSPDGSTLASVAEGNKSIHYWKFRRQKQHLDGHESSLDLFGREEYRIRALAFSSDGRYLASAASDCTVRLWGLGGHGVLCTSVICVPAAMNALAFSPDSTLLAGGSVSGAVQVWSITDGSDVAPRILKGNVGSIKSLTFLGDGRTLAWASWGNPTLQIWSFGTIDGPGKMVFGGETALEEGVGTPNVHAGDSPTFQRLKVVAPSGKLGIVVDNPSGNMPVVHAVKDTSALLGQVFVEDLLVGVDETDCAGMSALETSRLISLKSDNPERVLTLLRGTGARYGKGGGEGASEGAS